MDRETYAVNGKKILSRKAGVRQNSSSGRQREAIVRGRMGVEAVFPELFQAPATVDAA